jgi:hypothetical protein
MAIRTHDAARISMEPEIFPLVVDLDGTLTTNIPCKQMT